MIASVDFVPQSNGNYQLYVVDKNGKRTLAEIYFAALKADLKYYQGVFRIHAQAFQITGVNTYAIAMKQADIIIKEIQREIMENLNLFTIYTEGYSLN